MDRQMWVDIEGYNPPPPPVSFKEVCNPTRWKGTYLSLLDPHLLPRIMIKAELKRHFSAGDKNFCVCKVDQLCEDYVFAQSLEQQIEDQGRYQLMTYTQRTKLLT